jgi:hypothetical protein
MDRYIGFRVLTPLVALSGLVLGLIAAETLARGYRSS